MGLAIVVFENRMGTRNIAMNMFIDDFDELWLTRVFPQNQQPRLVCH